MHTCACLVCDDEVPYSGDFKGENFHESVGPGIFTEFWSVHLLETFKGKNFHESVGSGIFMEFWSLQLLCSVHMCVKSIHVATFVYVYHIHALCICYSVLARTGALELTPGKMSTCYAIKTIVRDYHVYKEFCHWTDSALPAETR